MCIYQNTHFIFNIHLLASYVKIWNNNNSSEIHVTHRIHKDLRRTVDLCQKAESAGVSWITVHGRTAEERHQPVHYDAIKTIKDSISIPVIANGDIKHLRDVESTYQLTGVDGRFVYIVFNKTAPLNKIIY